MKVTLNTDRIHDISFLGAAQEVTGSCYLVRADRVKFIVDCGLFQGGAESYRKNLATFQFEPNAIDFVLLTHAHTDHAGLLPALVGVWIQRADLRDGCDGRFIASDVARQRPHPRI